MTFILCEDEEGKTDTIILILFCIEEPLFSKGYTALSLVSKAWIFLVSVLTISATGWYSELVNLLNNLIKN